MLLRDRGERLAAERPEDSPGLDLGTPAHQRPRAVRRQVEGAVDRDPAAEGLSPRPQSRMLGLPQLLHVHEELEPEAAWNGWSDDERPVRPFRLDPLDHGERVAERVGIGQGPVDLGRRRVEAPLPLDVHPRRLVAATRGVRISVLDRLSCPRHMDLRADFPSDFLWGAATSAYQIEGAVAEDGRGASIWDTFCATPGKVRNGDSGAIACDSYHRYAQDIGRMRELGLDAYRFSIAWPRVLPEGRGRVNEAGLDFYDRLVDDLLAAGIRPFVSLYHWDLPQTLEDSGGWPERATAEAFGEYVQVVAGRLGDRVDHWLTQNEPFCISWLGYGIGRHAPGRTDDDAAAAAAHHVLLAHGLAVEVLRRESPNATVGIVLDSWPVYPASDDPRDVDAAWEADGSRNRFFFDPVLRGRYPEDVLERLGAPLPVRDGDLATISTPIDFVGLNHYSRTIVKADGDGRPVNLSNGGATTEMGWEIYPNGIYEVLTRLHREYAVPALYVTENGGAFPDVPVHDGRIDDRDRIDYLTGYLGAVARAVAEGVPVRGYFVWSLLDNFEWAYGYSRRFGLIYVDYRTLERVPKSSFYWYRDLIAGRRLPAPEPAVT